MFHYSYVKRKRLLKLKDQKFIQKIAKAFESQASGWRQYFLRLQQVVGPRQCRHGSRLEGKATNIIISSSAFTIWPHYPLRSTLLGSG